MIPLNYISELLKKWLDCISATSLLPKLLDSWQVTSENWKESRELRPVSRLRVMTYSQAFKPKDSVVFKHLVLGAGREEQIIRIPRRHKTPAAGILKKYIEDW